MKKIFLIFTIAFFALLSRRANAQELTNYNLYMQNYYLFNPAYTLDENCASVYLNSHLQWIGFDGAPKVNSFGLHGAINDKMGLGVNIVSKTHGLLSNLSGSISYSYRASFSENHYLAFGASLGAINDKLNATKTVGIDVNDPNILDKQYNKTTFSANVGVAYAIKGLEAQVILPQLLERSGSNFYTIGILAYNYQMNDLIKLKPSVLVRGAKVTPSQMEGNLMMEYNKKLWGQVGYRTNNGLIASLGFNIKTINIAYAYQVNNKALGLSSNSTHEVQILYSFKSKVCKDIVKGTLVSGTITDRKGNPVRNATIVVLNEKGKEVKNITTDENGMYKMELKPNQTYSLDVTSENYRPISETITLEEAEVEKTNNYTLQSDKILLTGKVSPKNAIIRIFDEKGNKVFEGTPDADGNYEAEVAVGGNYTLEIEAENYLSQKQNLTINDNEIEQNNSIELLPFVALKALITNKNLKGQVSIVVRDESGKIINSQMITKEFKTLLTPATYVVEVSGEGIIPMKETVKISKDLEKEYTLNFKVKVLGKNNTFKLGEVHFETGKSVLKDVSHVVLDELVRIMLDNSDFKIQINGYTDNSGNDAKNLILSQDRADACKEYAISKGIESTRLSSVGYGETTPLVPNTTEINKEINRRVEFEILK